MTTDTQPQYDMARERLRAFLEKNDVGFTGISNPSPDNPEMVIYGMEREAVSFVPPIFDGCDLRGTTKTMIEDAAPELLDALKHMLNWFGVDERASGSERKGQMATIKYAEDVIAKATGKAS